MAIWVLLSCSSLEPEPVAEVPALICEDRLCDWEVWEGEISPFWVWEPWVEGVWMGTSDTTLLHAEDAWGWKDCLEIHLTARSAPGSSLFVEADVAADESWDRRADATSREWADSIWNLELPGGLTPVRLRLVHEAGDAGKSSLAAAYVVAREAPCRGEPLEERRIAPGGGCEAVSCAEGASCEPTPVLSADGILWDAVCGLCASDGDCAEGEVCDVSYEDRDRRGYLDCISPPDRALGEACASDAACATGVCYEGQCSECRPDVDADCGRHPHAEYSHNQPILPYLFSPASGTRPSGALCLRDRDCESGECLSDRWQRVCVPDGRACASDAQCPYWGGAPRCSRLGHRDGVCL